jgi:hypothetical protein
MSGMGNLVPGMGNLAQNKRSFPSINLCKLGPSGEAKSSSAIPRRAAAVVQSRGYATGPGAPPAGA